MEEYVLGMKRVLFSVLITLVLSGTGSFCFSQSSIPPSLDPAIDTTLADIELIVRGVFLFRDADKPEELEENSQAKSMESFVRIHQDMELEIIWVHLQHPDLSCDYAGERLGWFLKYLGSKGISREVFARIILVRWDDQQAYSMLGKPSSGTVFLKARRKDR